MKKLICILGLMISGYLFPAQAVAIVGDWSGELDLGLMKLPVVFHIEKDQEGTLSATIDSPDQGVMGVPFEQIVMQEHVLMCEMKSLMAVYEGTLNEENSEIIGIFTQAGKERPLTLKPGIIAQTARPQEPLLPYPYIVEEVSYENPKAGVTLSGTLTRPDVNGPVPVAILIAGSGPPRSERSYSRP